MGKQTPVFGVEITGCGSGLPRNAVSNAQLVDASGPYKTPSEDQWIRDNVGIEQRYVCEEDETVATLGFTACKQALTVAREVPPAHIDKLFLATTTSGTLREIPGSHPAIQRMLREEGYAVTATDEKNTACTGFMTQLIDAYRYFVVDGIDNALVVGSDTLSRRTDYSDRGVGILFGDGAGAVYMQRTDRDSGLLGWYEETDGRYEEALYADIEPNKIIMDGPVVFKQAVRALVKAGGIAIERAIENAGINKEDIELVIPHQANYRIIDTAIPKLGFTMDQTVVTLDRHGNTSSGSIPLALVEAIDTGRVRRGMKILKVGFGAGMTMAAAVIEW